VCALLKSDFQCLPTHPVILKSFTLQNNADLNVSLWSFLIIGVGSIACVIGGYISEKITLKKTIVFALLCSGVCCLVSPIVFGFPSPILLITFLLFWGMTVIMDSPLLSTLVAQNADPNKKGTALTIVNCLGYCITIISIQLLNNLITTTNTNTVFMVLAIGPILGLTALLKKLWLHNLNKTP